MHKIKFRAWYNGSLVPWEFLDNDPFFDWFKCCEYPQGPGPWILEQFTGLHDKNGEEIYEGDIVRIIRYGGEVQTYGEVFQEKGAFHVRNGYAVSGTDILGQFKPNIIEVIGNIHENPELIKE